MAATSGGGTDDCSMAIKSLSACRCMNLREAVFWGGVLWKISIDDMEKSMQLSEMTSDVERISTLTLSK